MIVFFSGTNNSAFVARSLANLLGDECVPIFSRSLCNDKPIVFVCPTYCWRIPRFFSRLVKKSRFIVPKQAYFVQTCGSEIGNSAHYNRKLCISAGLDYKGTAAVLMPENYIAMYDSPSLEEAHRIVERSKPAIIDIANRISKGLVLKDERPTLWFRFLSGPVNPLFYCFFVRDKAFWTTDACISCTHCQKVCPMKNISMEEGRPAWHGKCTSCMACIASCPKKAIEYGKKSKGRTRYFNYEDPIRRV